MAWITHWALEHSAWIDGAGVYDVSRATLRCWYWGRYFLEHLHGRAGFWQSSISRSSLGLPAVCHHLSLRSKLTRANIVEIDFSLKYFVFMNQKVARIAYLLSMSRSTIDAATSAYADVYKRLLKEW